MTSVSTPIIPSINNTKDKSSGTSGENTSDIFAFTLSNLPGLLSWGTSGSKRMSQYSQHNPVVNTVFPLFPEVLYEQSPLLT